MRSLILSRIQFHIHEKQLQANYTSLSRTE